VNVKTLLLIVLVASSIITMIAAAIAPAPDIGNVSAADKNNVVESQGSRTDRVTKPLLGDPKGGAWG